MLGEEHPGAEFVQHIIITSSDRFRGAQATTENWQENQ